MHNKTRLIPFYPTLFMLYLCMKNGGISFVRLHLFLFFVIKSILLEPFRWSEIIFHENKIINHRLSEDPIFVIGHWRSGTTRLQQLLALDGNLTTTSVYQFVFIDNFIVTQKWLNPILNWVVTVLKVPYSFQRTPMNLNLPGEMEAAMCSFGSKYSYSWGHIFAKKHTYWINRMINLNHKGDSAGWLSDYDYLIKKISYASKGKRVIVKSPGDTGRIKYLKEKYPQAKFIYIERNPIAVYHSTTYFWNVINRELSMQHVNENNIHKAIIESYSLVMENYKRDKIDFEPIQLAELKFEEFIQNPIETLRDVYTGLHLIDFPERELEKLISKKSTHKLGSYDTSPSLRAELKSSWDHLIKIK